MQRIILSGFQGCGKNTVGEYLVEKYGYIGMSFADALKDAVAAIFCWDRALLEGNTPEAREWRETVDEWWAAKLGIENFTPRWMLRNFGTEIMREHFNLDIWISNVERRILDLGPDAKVVVFDGRFPNELDLVTKTLGGVSIRVKRGDEPVWYDAVAGVNNRKHLTHALRKYGFAYKTDLRDFVNKQNIHASERAWIGYDFTRVIENDRSIEDVRRRVDEMMAGIL